MCYNNYDKTQNKDKNMKIAFEKCQNVRDLGGLKTEDGRKIKAKRVLRTGNLSLITENDIAHFKSLDLRLVMPDGSETNQP